MNAHAGLLTGTANRAPWTEADAARMRDLWARRVIKADMALMMGRSAEAIASYIKKNRKDFPPRPHGRVAGKTAVVPLKVARPRAPSGVELRPDAVPAKNPVRLIHLSDWTCRWPVEGSGQDTLFCGAEPEGRSSYCACHRARSVGLARVAG